MPAAQMPALLASAAAKTLRNYEADQTNPDECKIKFPSTEHAVACLPHLRAFDGVVEEAVLVMHANIARSLCKRYERFPDNMHEHLGSRRGWAKLLVYWDDAREAQNELPIEPDERSLPTVEGTGRESFEEDFLGVSSSG